MRVGGAGKYEVAQLLWREVTPFVRAKISYILLLVLTGAVLTAITPLALKLLVDTLTTEARAKPALVCLLVVLYVVGLWLARIAVELRGVAYARASQRVFRTLSERMFSHLIHLPLRFHLDKRTGGINQTLENGLQGVRLILQHMVLTCLPVTVELATVVLVLARLVTLPLFLLFCGALVCYAGTFAYSAATVTKLARTASAARIEATAEMTDGLLNYENVKYFTAELLVQTRVARALTRCEAEWVGFFRRYATSGLVVGTIFSLFLAGTVFYATEQVSTGRMSIGSFVLVNTYMLQVVRPIELLGYGTQEMAHGIAMLENLVRLFREVPEELPSAARAAAGGAGALEFQDVSVSYGPERPVLSGVSFRVAAGHTVGIVGPSGSGKSTIVRLLMRLMNPDSGNILLDGVPISGLGIQDLRGSIAVVPQDAMLFADSISYNIAFGRTEASASQIESAARVAQLHEFVMTLPDRYETLVGERGVKLSGGERQRVSIARAVLKLPKVYVFDEATSSLDSETERDIVASLRAISRAHTTLVIAHRLSTVVHADEIIVLENGRIVERGGHLSLLQGGGRYAALWRAQQHGAAAA